MSRKDYAIIIIGAFVSSMVSITAYKDGYVRGCVVTTLKEYITRIDPDMIKKDCEESFGKR